MGLEQSTGYLLRYPLQHSGYEMKRLAIDARMIPYTGVGRYISNVLRHLPEIPGVQRILLLPSKYVSDFAQPQNKIIVSNLSRYTVGEQIILPYLIAYNRAAIFHSMNYIMPIWIHCPTIVTIYDIIRLRLPHTSYTNSQFISRFGISRFLQMGSIALLYLLRNPQIIHHPQFVSPSFQSWIYDNGQNAANSFKLHHLYQIALISSATKTASIIITISEHSKRDIIDFFGVKEEKIKVIYPGVTANFHRIENVDQLSEIKTKYKLPNRFALHVGLWRPHKNIQGLLRSFADLLELQESPTDFCLVLVGPAESSDDHVPRLIKELNLQGRVVCTGFVEDNDLPSLYTLAEFVVVPSFYEGFGLPALEAMMCETPVIVSKTSALPEVVGESGMFIEPDNKSDMVDKMQTLLLNPELRIRMSKAGKARARLFTWERAGNETARIYDTLLNRQAY